MGGSKPTRKPNLSNLSSPKTSTHTPSTSTSTLKFGVSSNLFNKNEVLKEDSNLGTEIQLPSDTSKSIHEVMKEDSPCDAKIACIRKGVNHCLNAEIASTPNALDVEDKKDYNGDSLAKLRADILKLKEAGHYPMDQTMCLNPRGITQPFDNQQKAADTTLKSQYFELTVAAFSPLDQAKKNPQKLELTLPKEVTRTKSLNALSFPTLFSSSLGISAGNCLGSPKASFQASHTTKPTHTTPPNPPYTTHPFSAPSSPCCARPLNYASPPLKPDHDPLGPLSKPSLPNRPKHITPSPTLHSAPLNKSSTSWRIWLKAIEGLLKVTFLS